MQITREELEQERAHAAWEERQAWLTALSQILEQHRGSRRRLTAALDQLITDVSINP